MIFSIIPENRKELKIFLQTVIGKKCFSIRKFEWKFTSIAFTQEIERGINFGLFKRVNGTHSVAISSNGQGTFSLTVRRLHFQIFVDKVLGYLYD